MLATLDKNGHQLRVGDLIQWQRKGCQRRAGHIRSIRRNQLQVQVLNKDVEVRVGACTAERARDDLQPGAKI